MNNDIVFDTILNHNNNGVLIIDEKNKIKHYNKAFLNMFSINDKDLHLMNKNLADFKEELFNSNVFFGNYRLFSELENNNEIFKEKIEFYKYNAVKNKRKKISLSCDSIPILDGENNYCGRYLVFEDVTFKNKLIHKNIYLKRLLNKKKVKLEEYKRRVAKAQKIQNRFISNVSHELISPLNSIIGFASFLLKKLVSSSVSDKTREYIENILISGKELLRLINKIIEVSKIESGNTRLELSYFSIKQVIESVIKEYSQIIKDKKLKVKTLFNFDYKEIYGDRDKIKEVINVIFSNAVKYNREYGHIKLNCNIFDVYMEVSIIDTGIGIKKENFKRIFKNFYQIDDTLKKEYYGIGLGLGIAKKFVEMHGGKIYLKSKPNLGTKFTFIIPLEYNVTKGEI